MNLVFLGAVIAVIAANQLVLRVAALRQSPWVFWGVQAINLIIACGLIVWPLPGFGPYAQLVSWILALMLVFRIIQNNLTRTRYLRRAVEDERAEEKRIRAQRLALRMDQEELEQRRALDEGNEPSGDPAVDGTEPDPQLG